MKEATGWPHDPDGAPRAKAMTMEEMTGVSDAERELAELRSVLFEQVAGWLEIPKDGGPFEAPSQRALRWLVEDIELLCKRYDVEQVGRTNLSAARRQAGYALREAVEFSGRATHKHLWEVWRLLGAAQ